MYEEHINISQISWTYVFDLIFSGCFVVRCDGNKNRIAAIEQYKDKLRADHAAHADWASKPNE